ncbi:MAG TPA: DUF480 domain-containing protein [Xanthomonadaceae bacterium]|nr:DUF480 domain-containing protein [Xanthomonadaceae bacterium]
MSEPLQILDPIQARVLGCLIEKSLTTPEQYPLTQNAVVVACNQKTSREPVMDLEPGAVGHALRTLEDRKLVKCVYGARAQRYEHSADAGLAITPKQRVLLALLMLRGPQTAAELLSRSDRMLRFHDLDDVRTTLERLCQREPALVVQVPRGPGQREDRYSHLLCGEPDLSAIAQPAAGAARNALESRIEELEHEVASLAERIASLESQIVRNTLP